MDQPSGPSWNVDDLPSSYNGATLSWDPERYDTAAMPFIVAIKQNFWSWRITSFETGTGNLNMRVELPSAMPDGMTMISFDNGDVAPSVAHAELVQLLDAMARILLDDPWSYQLSMTDGQHTAEFAGQFGPDGAD
jgi:hypothetical protein